MKKAARGARRGRRAWGLAALLIVLAAGAPVAAAQDGGVQDGEGVLAGRVVNAESGAAVSFAQVLLEEAARSTTAGADGRFVLVGVPAGQYTLKAFRVGYRPFEGSVRLAAGDTTEAEVRMGATTLAVEGIVVRGRRGAETLADRDVVLDDQALRRQMGATIASTLEAEPGIAMRSMGPAPARPVLRGLGGERLLVLEDGGVTGDLSHTSSDHAVTIEPMTAERIEVVRGPGALQYGPNVLAGAVNVVRGYVPEVRLDGPRATLSALGTSVSRGWAGSAAVEAPLAETPLGTLVTQADGSARRAQDVHTPAGVLSNTALATYNASGGASLVGTWGFAGGAASRYHSEYGIPGGFVGAHPNGVSIVMDRSLAELEGRYRPGGGALAHVLSHIDVAGRYTRYAHQEYEAGGLLGIEFGVLSYHGSVTAHTEGLGPLERGAVGVSAAYRDYASGGYSFTPRSTEQTLSAFIFQEMQADPFVVQAGLRFDHRRVMPAARDTSRLIGVIRPRQFAGVSAAVSGTWAASERLTLGARLLRSLRLPGIEELYSEGPHLAAYSFEVGNPALQMERGWGTELTARYEHPSAAVRLALFYNRISDYIFPQNTGEPSRVQLPIYQYRGAEARFVGGEAAATWRMGAGLEAEASASYVRATQLDAQQGAGRPLPQIPPLKGRLGVRYRRGGLTLGPTLRLAAAQERTGDFETATPGYAVLDVSAEYAVAAGSVLHTISLGVENVFNTEYRDHLSRVRVIMPEPGRNLRLLYRVHL